MKSIEKVIADAKLLSPQEQLRIIAELSSTLNVTANGSLDQLLPISNDMLAVKGHNLDMTVEGKSIYSHLTQFKEHLLEVHSNNDRLIKALPALKEKIKDFRLHAPEENSKELRKKIYDRTIITGDHEAYGGSTKTGVPGISYVRNEEFKQNVPVKELIHEIQGYELSEADAVRLFVVIAGLPKAGYQSYDGERYNVGDCGYIAFSAVQGDRVEFLYFNEVNDGLSSDLVIDAIPSLSN